jgi:hypothetical protein
MQQIILFSLVTASMTFTITETKLFHRFRLSMKRFNSLLGELFSCGYCFGHWVAFVLVALYKPRLFESWWLFDYFITALIISWFAAFQWISMCWLIKKIGK